MVLAIPLHRFMALDPALLSGKLVIDAMNYWPAGEGVQDSSRTARQQRDHAGRLGQLTGRQTLNHIGYHELEDRARPCGAPDRRASGLAADDPARWTRWRR